MNWAKMWRRRLAGIGDVALLRSFSGQPRSRRRLDRTRLALEFLEDRLAPAVRLNEVVANPAGGDASQEYIEILSTDGSDALTNHYLIEVLPGGVANRVLNLSAAAFEPGGNGILLIGAGYQSTGHPWGVLPSGTALFDLWSGGIQNDATFLLVHSTGETFPQDILGQDLDANNDGALDGDPWNTLVDAVALADSASAAYGGTASKSTRVDLATDPDPPDAAVRFPHNIENRNANAWYGGKLAASVSFTSDSGSRTLNYPSAFANPSLTPGSPNVPLTNTAPAIDLNGSDIGSNFSALFLIGGGPAVIVDSGLAITDNENTALVSATVIITNQQDGVSEVLAADVSGTPRITANYNASTGVLSLTGMDTLENYEQVLRTVTYRNTAGSPNGTDRVISFVGNDGIADSSPATSTVTFVNNLPPAIDLNGPDDGSNFTTTFTEDGGPVFIADSDASLTDGNDANLESLTVTITMPQEGDELSATASGAGISISFSNGVLTITGAASLADYQTMLRSVAFNNTSQNPNPSFPRTVTFVAYDGEANSSTRTTTVNVTAVNDPPVAANDNYAVDEDQTLTVNVPGVLANDSDADSISLFVSVVDNPSHGSVTLNFNGSFTYTPNANYHGSDSFTYKANDGTADGNTATVSITVHSVNDNPVANDDSYEVDEDQTLTIDAPGVLGNDTDADNDSLTAVVVTQPSHGTLTLNEDGSLTYTPNANYHGSDSFTYKANDGSADGNTATVSITVHSVNDNPVANDDSYEVDEDQTLTIDAPGVLGNDTDADNDSLTAVVVTQPSHGTLTLNEDGSLTYTPNANFHGSDSFTYKANDGSADGNTATVSITVNPTPDDPVANDDNYEVDEDQTLTIDAPGVLGNDTDADNDSLTAVVVTQPSHGTLTLNEDGSLTYTPNANFNGSDSFTYKANDGTADGNTATVSITVAAANDGPVNHLPTSVSTTVGVAVAIPDVSVDDPDAGNGLITVLLIASNGTLTVNPSAPNGLVPGDISGNSTGMVTLTGTLAAINTTLASASGLVYTPAANFAGNASLVMITSDLGNTGAGGAKGATSSMTIEVLRVATQFFITAPATVTASATSFSVTVSARDADGNLVTTYAGTATVSVTDLQGSVNPTDVTITNGVGTFDAILKTAGAQTFTATQDAITGQATVLVNPAAASQLVFVQQPTDAILNVPIVSVVVVELQDAFGNRVSSAEPVSLALRGAARGTKLGGTTTVAAVNGVAAFANLSVNKAATNLDLLASSPSLPSNDSAAFDVVAVSKFIVRQETPNPIVAGAPVTYSVQAMIGARPVTTYDGPVRLAVTDKTAVLPATTTLTGGTGNFTVTFEKSGRQTVTVSDVGLGRIKGTAVTTVAADVLNALRAVGASVTGAGKAYTLTVTAVDRFGNAVTGYNGTVQLSGAATPTATFTPRDRGTKRFTFRLDDAGLQTITATDTANSLTASVQTRVVREKLAVLDGTDLIIAGSPGKDTIIVRPTNPDGTQVEVLVNKVLQRDSQNQTTFSPQRILIFGLAGNDAIQLTRGTNPGPAPDDPLNIPTVIFGNDGNDSISAVGNRAGNILVGGGGNDKLTGGADTSGNILLGGLGKDTLTGGLGSDLLVADAMAHDEDLAALQRLLAEWNSGADYLMRLRRLDGTLTDGANDPTYLDAVSVAKDGVADLLFGGGGLDWFVFSGFGTGRDGVLDPDVDEVLTGR